MKRTSLTERMILYFLAMGVGAILVTGLFSFHAARKALLSRVYDQLTSVRITRKAAVERFFKERLNETAYLSSVPDTDWLQYSGFYSGWMLFDSTGNISSTGGSDSCLESVKRQFKVSISNSSDFFIADYLPEAAECRRLLSVARLKAGKGYLVLVIKPGLVDSIMLEVNPKHGLGYSGESYLTGPDHLMRTRSRFIENSVMHTIVVTKPGLEALAGKEGTILAKDYRGIEVLSSYSKMNIPGLDWAIMAELDYSEATSSVSAIRNNIILLSLLTAIILFILTYTVSRTITLPLKKLKTAVGEFSSHGSHIKLPVTARDEIGELTEAFNLMSENLKSKDAALKEERIKRVSSEIDGQERERQRLAREMHDGIGQGIVGVRLRLAALVNGVPAPFRDELNEIISINDNLINEVRATSNALMPPALAEFGLMSAIRSIGHSISETYGTEVKIEGELPNGLFGRKPVLYIFRIVQEAMNNAARHSKAGKLEVTVELCREALLLKIADNGIGFDPETAYAGHGLSNLKERVSLLNGTIHIDAAPGKGTLIKVEIPVNTIQYDKIIPC